MSQTTIGHVLLAITLDAYKYFSTITSPEEVVWGESLTSTLATIWSLLASNTTLNIKDTPQFETWFQQFHADSYFGVLGCALVGCVLTVMVQSSSATLGITISLAFQGVISYETAAALVLGEGPKGVSFDDNFKTFVRPAIFDRPAL